MELFDVLPHLMNFIYISIPIIGFCVWYKIRISYKISQLKQKKRIEKSEEGIEGSITKMIDNAPNQLKQIESEIATLQQKALKEGLTPEQTKSLLGRLESERDMLSYAVKYGGIAKKFAKPADVIFNKFLGGLTKGG